MRYHTYTDNKHVVVVTSTYAGKTVRGVAKCSPNDKFDLEVGETLAKARCDYKIETFRVKRARKECEKAMNEVNKAAVKQWKMEKYLNDSHERLLEAASLLDEMENKWN